MATDLGKFAVNTGRAGRVFAIVSVLSAMCLTVSIASATILLLGDHAALAPIVIEDSDPFPPPGILPAILYAIDIPSVILLAATCLCWLWWLVSCSHFARKAGARDMRFHPVMAVVWHFVPVMAYVMPMLVLAEVEVATRNPADWKNEPTSLLAANTWLVAKLAATLFGATAFLPNSAETVSDYVSALIWVRCARMLVLLGLLLANLFVRHVGRLQTDIVRSSSIVPCGDATPPATKLLTPYR